MPEEEQIKSPKKTTAEKRAERIRQLEARLQKEKALQNEQTRKDRNGQMIALGIFMEQYLKHQDDVHRAQFPPTAAKLLDERNLASAMAAYDRINAEIKAKHAKAAKDAEKSAGGGQS